MHLRPMLNAQILVTASETVRKWHHTLEGAPLHLPSRLKMSALEVLVQIAAGAACAAIRCCPVREKERRR